MLKKRVIPTLLLMDGRMVKGKNFTDYRETGEPNSAVRIYSSQDADELAFFDIAPNLESRSSLISIITAAAKECYMPLTVGGGISSINDIREIVAAGADKVVITSNAINNDIFLLEAIDTFGAQCIIAGIDYRKINSDFLAFAGSGSLETKKNALELAAHYAELGVGEIFLNSIDRDGCMNGYDIEFLREAKKLVDIPIIAAGGAGSFEHISEVFKETDVHAAACASLFHFGDNNPIRARSYLRNEDIPVRNLRQKL